MWHEPGDTVEMLGGFSYLGSGLNLSAGRGVVLESDEHSCIVEMLDPPYDIIEVPQNSLRPF